jgi:hypothetical protein
VSDLCQPKRANFFRFVNSSLPFYDGAFRGELFQIIKPQDRIAVNPDAGQTPLTHQPVQLRLGYP